MTQEPPRVVPCIGCVFLTRPNATGDGFRCTHPRAGQPDYVTGGRLLPRAQAVRQEGQACGPLANLKKESTK